MFRSALSWKNAWRVRIVALGFIVLLVGIGSQVLVNAVAAGAETLTLKVMVYTTNGRMADGNWTHVGACAVSKAQFPLGTVITLFDADDSLDSQCMAEDTNNTIAYGNIYLAMPGNAAAAIHWGVRYLSAQILRSGWGPAGPPPPTATSTKPLPPVQRAKPRSVHFEAR